MAKNSNAERFVKNLDAAFSRRMDEAQKALYTEKLSRWSCPETVWAKAMSLIVAECGFLPSLAEIYSYLKRSERPEAGPSFELFDVDGVRYARPVDLERRPALPYGAENVRLAVNQPAHDEREELPSPEEARAAFLSGYESVGGDRTALELALKLGMPLKPIRKLKPGAGVFGEPKSTRTGEVKHTEPAPTPAELIESELADYDDSDEALGIVTRGAL